MPEQPAKKLYTYNLAVSFKMRVTLREDEVEPSREGGPEDRDPTQLTLAKLEEELWECLRYDYTIDDLEVCGDFNDLLELGGE
jgi:hypothetical protein